jgi:hypothetical protein
MLDQLSSTVAEQGSKLGRTPAMDRSFNVADPKPQSRS